MSTQNRTRQFKILAIECPPELATLYQAPPNWFDEDGYLIIHVFPSDAAPDDTYLGEQGVKVTFTGFQQNLPKVQRGYRVAVKRAEANYFYLMDAIVTRSQTTPYPPIVVKDFARPEAADFAAAINATPPELPALPAEPFTLRKGVIFEFVPSGGLVGTVGNLYIGEGDGGFSFKFLEMVAR
jgi:hypothetical protein